MEDIVEGIAKGCLVQLLIWLIALPITLIITTPIILVAAAFGKDSYRTNMTRYYGQVTSVWLDMVGFSS